MNGIHSTLNRELLVLARQTPLADLEAAIVGLYLAQQRLTTHNRLLTEVLAREPAVVRPLRERLQGIIPLVDLDMVLRLFESILAPDLREQHGAVYTPRHITDAICARLLVTGYEVVADPSCGAGAFLLSAARRLSDLSGRPVSALLTSQLVGRDILEVSIRHARIVLALLALERGEDALVWPDRLTTGDALDADWLAATAATGIDVVVGNPPYVRFQELPLPTRARLSDGTWRTTGEGTYNLYFAFFEIGWKLLQAGGRLGYITPNAHFATRAARGLRAYLTEQQGLDEIIDCGNVSIFPDAATYPAITYLSRIPRPTFTFGRLEQEAEQYDLPAVRRTRLATAELQSAQWRLGYPEEMAFLHAVERVGVPLRELADLTVGLATLRDNLYLLGSDAPLTPSGYAITRGEQTFHIEAAVTRAVIKVSEHLDQASLADGTNRILYPYDETGDSPEILDEARLQAQYPGAYRYLCAIQEQLAERDHGKKTYEAWYAYGRRQGLRAPTRGQLLAPIYANVPRFLLDPAPGHRFINGYAVIPRSTPLNGLWATDVGLSALRALLESDAMALYVNLTSAPLKGGYRSYSGTYIAGFGIPAATIADLEFLARADCPAATRWYLEASGASWSDFLTLGTRLPRGLRCA